MKIENSIRIKIILEYEENQTLKTRDAFWKQVNSDVELSRDAPRNIENKLKKTLGQNIKEKLIDKFNQSIRDFDNLYYAHLKNIYLDEPLHFIFRRKDIDNVSYSEYFNSIVKLQEQKNEYFKDNYEYQRLLNKSLIASQIEFQVENLTYSSLSLSLIPDSIDKLASVFDNNFELFQTFLEIYLPDAFRNSIGIYDSEKLPINVQYDFSNSFKTHFENSIDNNQKTEKNMMKNNKVENDKATKAKWYWAVSNLSLVVPVILALIVIYFSYSKIDDLDKLRQENYKEIKLEKDKLLKEYKELLEIQKNTYQDLIEEMSKNTNKKK